MIVVIEAAVPHAGVLFEGVVLHEPFQRRLDARIVLVEAGKDHALKAGVRHRRVAPQAPFGRLAGHAFTAVGGGVVKATVGVLLGMGLIVVWPGEILRPRHEQERTLDGRIVGIGAGVPQRLDEEGGVGEIGAPLLPVARATVIDVSGGQPFRFVPLKSLEEGLGSLDLFVEPAILVAGGKRQQGDRRLVVADRRVVRMDSAGVATEAEQIVEPLADHRGIDRRATLGQPRDHQRRHRGPCCRRETAVSSLPLVGKELLPPGNRFPDRSGIGSQRLAGGSDHGADRRQGSAAELDREKSTAVERGRHKGDSRKANIDGGTEGRLQRIEYSPATAGETAPATVWRRLSDRVEEYSPRFPQIEKLSPMGKLSGRRPARDRRAGAVPGGLAGHRSTAPVWSLPRRLRGRRFRPSGV